LIIRPTTSATAPLTPASLDRVVGRVIDGWMPRAGEAKALRRLQQEMQMLLYTHPVNEERARGGLLPVNSFWASGTGALPQPYVLAAGRCLDDPSVSVPAFPARVVHGRVEVAVPVSP
jgi:hypothetical protein